MLSHLRNYASAGVITGVVGLFSFPILTRNLSVAEYGIVGLIFSSLTLFIALGKMGVQHAVVRYYAQVKHANTHYSMLQLNSTVSVIFFTQATITTSLWLVSGVFLLPNVMQYENLPELFALAASIVFIRLMGSSAINFLRAQQRSGDVAVSQSISRCLNLIFVLTLLAFSSLSPSSVITCLLIAEVFGVGYAFYCYSPSFNFSSRAVPGSLVKAMLVYGFPLMILESLELALRLSDRYMIESMLGSGALGQYSASYNITGYIDLIVIVAMAQALKPAYMNLWEAEGKEATQAFLSKFFRVYLILGIPFVAIFAATAPHLLRLLAGERYAPGTVIIPYLAINHLLVGAMQILAAGLFIFKDTKVLVTWSAIATVVNILLNLIFIPIYGIVGAAIVTLLSFAVYTVGVAYLAFRNVSFPIDLRAPCLMGVVSCLVFYWLCKMDFGAEQMSLLIKGAFGTLSLALTMWLIEPEVRTWVRTRILAFWPTRGGS